MDTFLLKINFLIFSRKILCKQLRPTHISSMTFVQNIQDICVCACVYYLKYANYKDKVFDFFLSLLWWQINDSKFQEKKYN